MKSQEQRIEDAAKVIARADGYDSARDVLPHHREEARRILEAADREPPKWPTDETVKTIWHRGWVDGTGEQRLRTREAFMADPIIKAAIAYRDENHKRRQVNGGLTDWPEGQALADAVNEAGL